MDEPVWWKRWVYLLDNEDVLHRVKAVTWEGWSNGSGELACGAAGPVWAPGFISRTQAPRCPMCCKAAGVPEGNGNPHNNAKPEGGGNG